MLQKSFISLELSLESQSRHNFPAFTSHKSDGLLELPILFLHEIGNKQRRGLDQS